MPTLFVLTKIDKLKPAERREARAHDRRQLGIEQDQVLPFSSTTGEGRDELLESLRTPADMPYSLIFR
jgi:GTP-binding protein EngB required for normal cell division